MTVYRVLASATTKHNAVKNIAHEHAALHKETPHVSRFKQDPKGPARTHVILKSRKAARAVHDALHKAGHQPIKKAWGKNFHLIQVHHQ